MFRTHAPNSGVIVVLYKADPEYRLKRTLQDLIGETYMSDRSVPTDDLFIEGHPIFSYLARGYDSNGQGSSDTFFPKVGVDWMRDDDEWDIGAGNISRIPINDALREQLISARDAGSVIVGGPHDGSPSARVEMATHPVIDKILGSSGFVEKYHAHATSRVQLNGWSVGEAGRTEHKWIYQVVKGMIPFAGQIMAGLGLRTRPDFSGSQIGMFNDQIIGVPAFGFSFDVLIGQTVEVMRFTGDSGFPANADIYPEGSKTRFSLTHLSTTGAKLK